jgi:hypothetical protein
MSLSPEDYADITGEASLVDPFLEETCIITCCT